MVVASACGVGHDGPPPRFADAPPEPTAASGPAPEQARTEPDAGASDGGPPAAIAPDAAPATTEADGGAPAPLLATGPLTRVQWDQMLEVGRRKFNRVCSECHGTGIGPMLNGRRRSAERVREIVRRGGGDMRPISQRRVSDEDLESVIVFLTTIRAVADVRPPDAPAQ